MTTRTLSKDCYLIQYIMVGIYVHCSSSYSSGTFLRVGQHIEFVINRHTLASYLMSNTPITFNPSIIIMITSMSQHCSTVTHPSNHNKTTSNNTENSSCSISRALQPRSVRVGLARAKKQLLNTLISSIHMYIQYAIMNQSINQSIHQSIHQSINHNIINMIHNYIPRGCDFDLHIR